MDHNYVVNEIKKQISLYFKNIKEFKISFDEAGLAGPVSQVLIIFPKVVLRTAFLHKGQILSSSIKRIPYNDTTDYMSVKEFLKVRKSGIDMQQFSLSFYSGNETEKIRQLIEWFASILNLEFSNILNGDEWDENSFSDWTTFKV